MTARASSPRTPLTTGRPRLMIPAFSAAIAPRVEPSRRVWSNEIVVSTETSGRTALVESSRPPMPTSTTASPTPAPGEVEQAHRRGDLEEGRPAEVAEMRVAIEPLDGRPDGLDQARDLGRRRLGPIDPEPLAEPVQVGRREQPGPPAGGGRDGGDHGRGRALPLGPGDVDDRERLLRVAQRPEEPAHPADAEVEGGRGHADPLVVDPAVEEAEPVAFVVGHEGPRGTPPGGRRPGASRRGDRVACQDNAARSGPPSGVADAPGRDPAAAPWVRRDPGEGADRTRACKKCSASGG